eukprot:8973210-Lingulodinium_polyedra.AAC.1
MMGCLPHRGSDMGHHLLTTWWDIAHRTRGSAAILFVDAADAYYAARTDMALAPSPHADTPSAIR